MFYRIVLAIPDGVEQLGDDGFPFAGIGLLPNHLDHVDGQEEYADWYCFHLIAYPFVMEVQNTEILFRCGAFAGYKNV